MGTEFELSPELSARVDDFAAQTARTRAVVQERRRLLFGLAGEMLAAGQEAVVIRSTIVVEVVAPAVPGLDVPGSRDERLADALIGAVDAALEGQPLGECPPLWRPGDFDTSDDVYRPLAGAMARIANGPDHCGAP